MRRSPRPGCQPARLTHHAATVLDASTPLKDAFAQLASDRTGRALVRDDGHGYGYGLLALTDVARLIESQRASFR